MSVMTKPFAEELVTVSNTSKPLTAATYNATSVGATSGREYAFAGGFKADSANVEVKTESIYYTLNGGTPTSDDHVLNTGDILKLESYQTVKDFRAIRTGASDATLAVTYYKES